MCSGALKKINHEKASIFEFIKKKMFFDFSESSRESVNIYKQNYCLKQHFLFEKKSFVKKTYLKDGIWEIKFEG